MKFFSSIIFFQLSFFFFFSFSPLHAIVTSQKGYESEYDPGEKVDNAFDFPIKVIVRADEDTYAKESIRLRVSLYNQSDEKFHFRLDKQKFNRFRFKLEDDRGEPVSETLAVKRFFLESQSNFDEPEGRWISLDPNEQFSFVVYLEDFFNIDIPGRYFLSGYFYPLSYFVYDSDSQRVDNSSNDFSEDLSFSESEDSIENTSKTKLEFGKKVNDYKIKITPLSLEILPSPFYQNNFEREQPSPVADGRVRQGGLEKGRVGQSHQAVSYSPGQVVKNYFQSIQTKEWATFFDSINLEKYLLSLYPTTDYFERYQSSYPHEKKIIMSRFKNYLVQSIDYDVLDYNVMREFIEGQRAEVDVEIQTREAFQKLLHGRDWQSGLGKDQWVDEPTKKLVRRLLLRMTLEKETVAELIPEIDEASGTGLLYPKKTQQWKITGYQVRMLPENDDVVESSSDDFFIEAVLFDLNEATLKPDYLNFLDRLAAFLSDNPSLLIAVVGYTDDLGSEESNYILSLDRAKAVYSYLQSKGVSAQRVTLIAKGEKSPVKLGHSEEARRLNRRVDVLVKEVQ